MADYKENNMNGTNAANGTNNGYPAQGYAPGAGYSQPGAPGYRGTQQNGYMHTAQQTPGGGYSYSSYYTGTPAGTMENQMPAKKKKHTGLKIVAVCAALAMVSGGSILAFEGIRSGIDATRSNVIAEERSTDTAQGSADEAQSDEAASDDSQTINGNADSWIALAQTEGTMSVPDIVDKVTPSVVGVQSTFQNGDRNSYYGGFYGFFGGSNGGGGTATGVGTGIVISADGYIVTNAHVVYDDEYGYGEATAVNVRMSDQTTTYEAQIVAYDKSADIAVLKIDAPDLVPAEFGDSSNLRVGEMVVAIGNPLGLEFQNTVTCGIVSALNRDVTINDHTMTLIQTDTAINSGNSGGPLINSSGQVVGINSAKMSSSYLSGASVEGICFAIPITEAKSVVDDLINYGYVTGRPRLGINCQNVSESVSKAYQIPVGVYVISVAEGGAAEHAGVQVGDVITAIQDTPVKTTEEMNAVKNKYNAGDTVKLTIMRQGTQIEVNVTLEEASAQNQVQTKKAQEPQPQEQ